MAERTKFMGYMAYTALFAGIVYPIFGHWAWGSLSSGFEANFGGGTGWLGRPWASMTSLAQR